MRIDMTHKYNIYATPTQLVTEIFNFKLLFQRILFQFRSPKIKILFKN